MLTTILILIAVGGILVWTFVQDRDRPAAEKGHHDVYPDNKGLGLSEIERHDE